MYQSTWELDFLRAKQAVMRSSVENIKISKSKLARTKRISRVENSYLCNPKRVFGASSLWFKRMFSLFFSVILAELGLDFNPFGIPFQSCHSAIVTLVKNRSIDRFYPLIFSLFSSPIHQIFCIVIVFTIHGLNVGFSSIGESIIPLQYVAV